MSTGAIHVRAFVSAVAIVFLQAVVSAPAWASMKLAEQKQCLQCHAVARDTIGPSFQTIQAVYKKVRNPEAKLIAVIQQGSAANLGPHWGRARMPDDSERPKVSDREARELARWIMARPRG
jgi:cytochrome c